VFSAIFPISSVKVAFSVCLTSRLLWQNWHVTNRMPL